MVEAAISNNGPIIIYIGKRIKLAKDSSDIQNAHPNQKDHNSNALDTLRGFRSHIDGIITNIGATHNPKKVDQ